MGLTVYYDFRLPLTTTATEVQARLARWREFAIAQKLGRVSAVRSLKAGDLFADAYLFEPDPDDPHTSRHFTVPVLEGWQFVVQPGEGCEPLRIALCRYPAQIEADDGERRRTRLGGAWRYQSFCKTQYASLRGWEAFLRAHRGVIECLAHGRELGARVGIRDEGGYWPRRSVRTLRQRIGEMNGLVAAVAGAFKDAIEEAGGEGLVEAPIFAHPEFERLELAGEEQAAGAAELIREVVRREREERANGADDGDAV